MAKRIIYKHGKEFVCDYAQASKMVAEEGWSWTNTDTASVVFTTNSGRKKSGKPKKVKVEAEADVLPIETIDNGNPINQDHDIENQEND